MAVRFGLYFFTETVGDYLQQVINATPLGVVTQAVLITDRLPLPEEGQADAWIIEYNNQAADMEEWLEAIRQQLSHPFIILYLRDIDTELLLKALRLGVQECLVREITKEDLSRVSERLLRTKRRLGIEEETQLVALLGAKGGVGVTFLAINLAQTLVELKQPTLLLDLDLVPGGLTGSLDMKTRYNLMDVITNFDRLDPQYLKDIIHRLPNGLQVLPGPEDLDQIAEIQGFHISKILQYLRTQQMFRWLICDLGDSLTEVSLKVLEQAEVIILVTCLTVPGLRAAKKVAETLAMLRLAEERLWLVANAVPKKGVVPPNEGQKYLGRDFAAVLAFDPEGVWRSLNEGQPLAAKQPQRPLAGQIGALARRLLPESEDRPKSRFKLPFANFLGWRRK